MCAVVIDAGPDLAGIILFYTQDVIFVVIVDVEVRQVITTVFQDNKYLVFSIEFAKILPLSIIVEALDIAVEPDFSTA